ncbi:unnamed protein product [Mesocestoides corti]|uniref:Uncharacterized protein n=1 Tax=Mesocestoides corti TaxID=53468 RepID=A0A0R3UCZ1_MESCO|nr:unnamed protein product [Mesocestoides corti]
MGQRRADWRGRDGTRTPGSTCCPGRSHGHWSTHVEERRAHTPPPGPHLTPSTNFCQFSRLTWPREI